MEGCETATLLLILSSPFCCFALGIIDHCAIFYGCRRSPFWRVDLGIIEHCTIFDVMAADIRRFGVLPFWLSPFPSGLVLLMVAAQERDIALVLA